MIPAVESQPEATRIPLFPLPNVVHFPRTELKLHIFEPRYRRLVRDLLEAEPEARRIGMVLSRPRSARDGGHTAFFPGGTAGRLVDVDPLPDGRSNIILIGEFRFQVRQEVPGTPYRQAVVQPMPEPTLNEADPGILAVRRDLDELVGALSVLLGERFPLSPKDLAGLEGTLCFEEVVNRIAAGLDLPPLAKLALLREVLPERALSLVGVLRGRIQALELLGPYRHLDAKPELN